MREPLDFSGVGTAKGAARPAPARPPRRRGRWRRPAALALVVVVAGAGAWMAFGRDGDDEPAASTSEEASLARYCALAGGLEVLLAQAAAAPDPAAAMASVMEQLGGSAPELEASAPADVRDDVRGLLGALRQAARGDPAPAQSPSFERRRQAVHASRESCPVGAGEGDA